VAEGCPINALAGAEKGCQRQQFGAKPPLLAAPSVFRFPPIVDLSEKSPSDPNIRTGREKWNADWVTAPTLTTS
jgi:hypothetical protein